MTSTSVLALKLDNNGKFNKEDLHKVFHTIPDDIVAWLYPVGSSRGRVFKRIWDSPKYMNYDGDVTQPATERTAEGNNNPFCPLSEKNGILKPKAGTLAGTAGNPPNAGDYVTKSVRVRDPGLGPPYDSAPEWVTVAAGVPTLHGNGELIPDDTLHNGRGEIQGYQLVDFGGGGRNDAVKVRKPFKKKRGRKTIKKNT